jgi:16S rRNA (cytidine1402-2'-O)-methyltransferase
VAGALEVCTEDEIEARWVLSILLAELPIKQAVELAARITGARKNALYDQALQLRQDGAQ